MPDLQILVCGTAMDPIGSRASVELLRNVALPSASKFVVTTGKFETDEAIKFNVEARYPAELPQLQTTAAAAGLVHDSDSRLRDGHDLFCLRSILRKHGPFSHALLVRNGGGLGREWSDLREMLEDRLFMVFGSTRGAECGTNAHCNVLFHLEDTHSANFLERAWELYASGTVYAFEEYSFEVALCAAAESLRIDEQIIT